MNDDPKKEDEQNNSGSKFSTIQKDGNLSSIKPEIHHQAVKPPTDLAQVSTQNKSGTLILFFNK